MKKYILWALLLALALTGCGPEAPAEPDDRPHGIEKALYQNFKKVLIEGTI